MSQNSAGEYYACPSLIANYCQKALEILNVHTCTVIQTHEFIIHTSDNDVGPFYQDSTTQILAVWKPNVGSAFIPLVNGNEHNR